MEDIICTDAVSYPPRENRTEETANNDNSTETPKVTNIPSAKSAPSSRTSKTKKPPKLNNWPQAITFNNCNGFQIGNNKVININPDAARRKSNEILKTKEITELLELEKPVDKEHIQLIAKHADEGWKNIGRQLDYSDGQIDQFYLDHHQSGIKEVIYQLLLDWIRNEPTKATLGNLAGALWESDQRDVVRRLANFVHSST